jgi:hypothetical protein
MSPPQGYGAGLVTKPDGFLNTAFYSTINAMEPQDLVESGESAEAAASWLDFVLIRRKNGNASAYLQVVWKSFYFGGRKNVPLVFGTD